MFHGMSALTSLDLSSFVTTNVTNMSYMFEKTNNLTTLNLSNATFNSVTTYSGMFTGTKSGITITAKDETAKTWLEARLTDVSKTGTVTIATSS